MTDATPTFSPSPFWMSSDDFECEYVETSDPRVFAVIERDSDPSAPYGDALSPAYFLEYRYSWSVRVAGDTFQDSESQEIAEAYARALNLGGEEFAERFLRAFYDSVCVTLDTRDAKLLLLDTPSYRAHVGRPTDVRPWAGYNSRYALGGVGFDPVEWFAGELSEWDAYTSGDVWGVGYATLPGRVIDTGEMPSWEDISDSVEIECWGFYGADYARSSAVEFSYGAPELPELLTLPTLTEGA